MTCRICGAELPVGAMFCGECGSSTSATPESRRRPDPRPGDTTAIERPARQSSGVISIPVDGFHAARPIGEPGEAEQPAVLTAPRFVRSVPHSEQRFTPSARLNKSKPHFRQTG